MKLGLIAMSGVRIENEALMRLGLTLPGFVERSKVIASLPSLALLTLAGLTPEDIEVTYVEVPSLAALDGLAGEFDAVAISSYTAQIKDAYRLADRYRKSGTVVILGGLHVTACPDEAARHANTIVLGEAESVWPRVMHDLRHGALQPLYDCRGVSFDLAEAQLPRFDLLDVARYNRLIVQTQRGCPLSCAFCASSIRIAPRFKTKPVEKVIAEIGRIKSIWPDPFIELADDNTFASKAHGKRLAAAMAKEKVRWFTETDISVADDEDLLSMIRDAGCAQLLIGFEAPDRKALDGVETKANWKAERADTYLAAIRRIQAKGISVNGCFVLGLDGQGTGSFERVARFVCESGLAEVQVTLATPFPGTPLYEQMHREGRLLAPDPWERCTLFDATFTPKALTVGELESRFAELVAGLYSDEARTSRRTSFRRQVRKVRTQASS